MLAAGLVGGIFIGRYTTRKEVSSEELKLRTVMELIDMQYVDEVNTDSLLENAIPDILAMLDPHSVYIPASELQVTNDDLEASFGGIGVMFQVINDTVNVIEVVGGGPAETVGLLPGDQIISAGGKALSGVKVTNEDVFSTLRGKEGTIVKLEIKRGDSPKTYSYEVTRGRIPSHSIDASYMIGDGIGYIKVGKFAKNTYKEFLNALVELQLEGAHKYVIDLRGNSGGFMDQAIYMANEFLPAGRTIVYTKGRMPENETMAVSDGRGSFQNSEITVVTNEYSASASEIFAGAIQDNDRGLVIGRRTFGKGLVQNQLALPDSSAIRLTVARYFIPSGRSIQKEYKRGKNGKYELDILDRYNHGEFYNQDSIKLDKTKSFTTFNGRTVFGGGGIMPDIFVPEDTIGITSYYLDAQNMGLIQKFARDMAKQYRPLMKDEKTLENMNRILPRDRALLTAFVNYASRNGLPARWYYINKSADLLVQQLRAWIARDLVGFEMSIQLMNQSDLTVLKAVKVLQAGDSPLNILKGMK